MNTVMDWARHILTAGHLEDKLTPFSLQAPLGDWRPFILPQDPGRHPKLSFSEKQLKFPRRPSLAQSLPRAQALHSFANHELLAIEMMAAALLVYPHGDAESVRVKRGLMAALRDEQKHLAMYVARLQSGGYDFGDFPLNAFFWRQMEKLATPSSFFALMALTFESANLDFALYYQEAFLAVGDVDTAEVLRVVYQDELTHVALGAHWLDRWKQDRTLWDYYLSVLPAPLTPARARGIQYRPETRLKAGLPQDWVRSLSTFEDPFQVTQRRGVHAADRR
jgi:uncharacterized ferritin-like protein (DUF455 family)